MIALAPGIVNCKCRFCGIIETIHVDHTELTRYNTECIPVQDAFPNLDPFKRAFISRKICEKCYRERYLNFGNQNASHNSVNGDSRVFKQTL